MHGSFPEPLPRPDRVGRDLEVRARRQARPVPDAGARHADGASPAPPPPTPAALATPGHRTSDPDLPTDRALAGRPSPGRCAAEPPWPGPGRIGAGVGRDRGPVGRSLPAEGCSRSRCRGGLPGGVTSPVPNDDGTVVVWDLQLEAPLRLIRPGVPRVASMAFSDSGSMARRRRAGIAPSEVFDATGRQAAQAAAAGPRQATEAWSSARLSGVEPRVFGTAREVTSWSRRTTAAVVRVNPQA